MQNSALSTFFFMVIVCAWLIPLFAPNIALPVLSIGRVDSEFVSGTMLFVGDVMLGRHVETLAKEHGDWYPFIQTTALLQGADVTIGNFEAAIPKKHAHTPNLSYTFSVHPKYLGVMKGAGFDILSLANNHGFDYGEAGYANTLYECSVTEIECKGHPYRSNANSTTRIVVGEMTVGLAFINATDKRFKADPAALYGQLSLGTDLQLAYVHWGEEYESLHNARQEALAHSLIDSGFDAVIGHHPHVVEDIGVYQGKPIFYSLGNFIFDQYFSVDVQEGLGVMLTLEKDSVSYTLIPFTSIGSRSSPRIMSVDEKRSFLGALIIDPIFGELDGENPKLFVVRE